MYNMEFDFIKDDVIKKMCESDFEELKKAIKLNLVKSSLILIGSIIESVLYYKIISDLEYTNKIPNFEKRNEKSITLEVLFAESYKVGLIDNELFQSLKTIQTYRNSIHPNVYIKMESKFNRNDIISSYHVLLNLLRKIAISNSTSKNDCFKKVNELFNELFSRAPTVIEKHIYSGLIKKYPYLVVKEIIRRNVVK